MPNQRFLQTAKRQKNPSLPVERFYPTPEEYSMSKDSYYNHLRERDEFHPERVEEALNSIRTVYRNLRSHYGAGGLVVVSVGSSLVHTAYNDIDVVLLGIQNGNFREKLFEEANKKINGSQQNKPNQHTFFYAGGGGLSGQSTSDILPPRDYLIDLILDNSGRSFEEWHRMMVNISQRYCILDKDVEKPSQGGNN